MMDRKMNRVPLVQSCDDTSYQTDNYKCVKFPIGIESNDLCACKTGLGHSRKHRHITKIKMS